MFRYHNLQTNLQTENNSDIMCINNQLSPKLFSVGNKRNLLGRHQGEGGGYNQYSQHDSRAEKGKESNIKNTNVQV